MFPYLRSFHCDASLVEYSSLELFLQHAVQLLHQTPCVVESVDFVRLLDRINHRDVIRVLQPLQYLRRLDFRRNGFTISHETLAQIVRGVPQLEALHLHLEQFPRNAYLDGKFFACLPRLEELGVVQCTGLHCISSIMGQLRRLNAESSDLTDRMLTTADKLEVLHVAHCGDVTTVAPFAYTLRELDASGKCGIHDAGLARAHWIRVLNVANNSLVTTVEPFAESLRELNASDGSMVGDTGLANATGIVRLLASNNSKITTVSPFAESLRELQIAGVHSGIGDRALTAVSQLVSLHASLNASVRTVAPFGPSLVHLDASFDCGIDDAGLTTAVNLVSLNTWNNKHVTTVLPCASSLLHLNNSNGSIGDSGLACASALVELEVNHNSKVTQVSESFMHSLRRLTACGKTCGISDKGLAKVAKMVVRERTTFPNAIGPSLHVIARENDKVTRGVKDQLEASSTSASASHTTDVSRFPISWINIKEVPITHRPLTLHQSPVPRPIQQQQQQLRRMSVQEGTASNNDCLVV